MMEDEFFLDDDDLNDDYVMTEYEKESAVVIGAIEKVLSDMKDELKFGEKKEYKNNLSILSNYVSSMVEIDSMNESNSVEALERLKEIDKAVREVSFVDAILDIPVDEERVNGIDLLPESNSDSDFDF